jgi:TPR repeat protein
MKRILFTAVLLGLFGLVWPQGSQLSAQGFARQPTVNDIWRPAHRGDRNAQFQLGLRYGSGNGIAKNMVEAAKWYRRAADLGHAKAQAMLGVLYNSGQGVPRSQAEAIKWWRRAADQGDPDARFNLGMAYWKGDGVTQDFDKANALFRSMAPAGSAYARSVLGTRARPGPAAPQSAPAPQSTRLEQPRVSATPQVDPYSPNGFRQYLAAAQKGDPKAQSQVGYMYAVGLGVAQNFVEAHKWTNIAAALLPPGRIRESSIGNRNAAAAQMSPQQILRAQRLARDWLAAYEKRRR